jgi:Fe2+ or Zn2+ uptake regulation protein
MTPEAASETVVEYDFQCFCGAPIVSNQKMVSCTSCGRTFEIRRVGKRTHHRRRSTREHRYSPTGIGGALRALLQHPFIPILVGLGVAMDGPGHNSVRRIFLAVCGLWLWYDLHHRLQAKLTSKGVPWWRESGVEEEMTSEIVSECGYDFQCLCGARIGTIEEVTGAKVVMCANCGKTVEIGLRREQVWNLASHRETWGGLQAEDVKKLLPYMLLFSLLLYDLYDLLHC